MARFHLEMLGQFFPPLAEGDETPEFIRWAVKYSCTPREHFNGEDVEQLHRQLRPLAAVGEAWAANALVEERFARTGDGHQDYEFDATKVLPYYGASKASEVPCLNCPANGLNASFPKCVGVVSRNGAIEQLIQKIEPLLKSTPSSHHLIPATNTRWYGIWAGGPLFGKRLVLTSSLVDEAVCLLDCQTRAMLDLQLGLRLARELNVAFHVQPLPAGVIRRGRWEIPPYCGFCGGVRINLQRHCKTCGHAGHWKSPEKRHPIGIRPYRAVKLGK